MTKTIVSTSSSNQSAKIQERKTKRQKGYNSTCHDKPGVGLGTQTWHGAREHVEDSIKHVANVDPSTLACENIALDI